MVAAAPSNAYYAQGMARAFAGALIFSFPLLMTMEMWWLGFYADPLRLALFLGLGLPGLYGLSYYAGFRHTFTWQDDVLDALAAYAVGFAASAALLTVFAVIEPGLSPRELVGTVAIQALPAAIGALLARSQLRGGGGDDDDHDEDDDEGPSAHRAGYVSQLFLMMIGAVFVAFNVAPTEEMILIAYQMNAWHAVVLALASLGLLHAFVYKVGFAGQEAGHGSGSGVRTFLHFTLAGYAIALLLSLYILWTFGRTDGVQAGEVIKIVVVLAFPASLGAAAARLLV